MNKLSELVFAIQCQYEFERPYRKGTPKKKGLQRLSETFADISKRMLYFAILGFCILRYHHILATDTALIITTVMADAYVEKVLSKDLIKKDKIKISHLADMWLSGIL